jgi:hypothetical protein
MHILKVFLDGDPKLQGETTCANVLIDHFVGSKRLYIGEHVTIKTSKNKKTEQVYKNYMGKFNVFFNHDKLEGRTLYANPKTKKSAMVTVDDWKDISTNKVGASFLLKPYFDCRAYGSSATPTNSIAFDILQFITATPKAAVAPKLMFGFDNDQDDGETPMSNDIQFEDV